MALQEWVNSKWHEHSKINLILTVVFFFANSKYTVYYITETVTVITNDGRNIVVRSSVRQLQYSFPLCDHQQMHILCDYIPLLYRVIWRGSIKRLISFWRSRTRGCSPPGQVMDVSHLALCCALLCCPSVCCLRLHWFYSSIYSNLFLLFILW